jgi:hypothetical protein
MIATYRVKSNVGFIMYIADSFGYLASVVILFLKEFIGFKLTWTSFFTNCIIYTSIIGIAGTIFTAAYFKRKYSSTSSTIPTAYAI